MPDRVRTLAQPPIVWGPSEVNEWISGSFPSESHGASTRRRLRGIRGITVRVLADAVPPVRARIVEAFGTLGYTAESTTPPLRYAKGGRTIVARFLPALLKDSVTVTMKFAPPAHHGTAERILRWLEEEFPLGKVTLTEAPPDEGPRQRGRAKSGRSSRGSPKT